MHQTPLVIAARRAVDAVGDALNGTGETYVGPQVSMPALAAVTATFGDDSRSIDVEDVGVARERRTGGVSASELISSLEADPDYLARSDALAEQRAAIGAARRAEASLVLEDLRGVGCHLTYLWSEDTRASVTAEAVPVLIAHLRRPYSDVTLQGIASALPSKLALAHWPELLALYRTYDRETTAQGLPSTLSSIASKTQLPHVLEILADRDLPFRVFFLRTLNRLRVPQRWEIIEQALLDEDLAKEARHLLHQRDLRSAKGLIA